MSEFTDQIIECVDCGKEFSFTAAGQEFFAQKGFDAPKRCKECRAQKKAQKERKKQHENEGGAY